MARKPNYGFEKKQREIRKQKKREAKAEKRRLRKEAASGNPPAEEATEAEEDRE